MLAAIALVGPASAQRGLSFSLFERYLDSLRQQVGIPGLSAAIVQGRRIVWERGFGLADVEASVAAQPDTPYPVADLTQPLAATLLLQQCLEREDLQINDRVVRWNPQFPDATTTVGEVLAHGSPGGTFQYDPPRYVWLARVIEECGDRPYRTIVTQEVLDRLAMTDSVPGSDLADATNDERRLFAPEQLARYSAVLGRMAAPYRVDGRGRATRSDLTPDRFTPATGLVSSVRDLWRFSAALDDRILLHDETLQAAWTNAASRNGLPLPMGLGWFVQEHNGERLVWHFGLSRDAYSSLVLKVPGRGLTLILLANSDGLSAPFDLAQGDVTASLFARVFLRLFVT